MSYFEEYCDPADLAWYEARGIEYEEQKEILSEKTDSELIELAIQTGKELDEYEHFPAYTVATQLRQMNRLPSERQREAVINCMAYYLMNEEYPE